MNMLATIVPKSDQINADDLIGRSLTITINEVRFSGGQEQPVSMYFEGSEKAFRPCKSMCRVLVAAWGPDAKEYVGRSLTLYRDPSVKWGGLEVGGIRISHMTHLDAPMTMALTATKGSRKPYTVKPLVAEQRQQPAELTLDQARADLEFAPDLDALKAVWTRKAMAPFRAELQAALDARKAELSGEGPSETDRGESHNGTDPDHPMRATVDAFLDKLRLAKTGAGVDAMLGELDRDALSEDLLIEVDAAVSDVRAVLS